MIPALATYPSWGVDCVSVLDSTSAAALRAAGASFAVRYLWSVSSAEIDAILGAGLAVSLVTYADRFSGPEAAAALRTLGIPPGVTAWLDVEGVTLSTDATIAAVDTWALAIIQAGYQPGIYVGASSGLTGAELYDLSVVRYWRSASLVPEPSCGYCLTQGLTTTIAGVQVDVDYVLPDHERRLPVLVGA